MTLDLATTSEPTSVALWHLHAAVTVFLDATPDTREEAFADLVAAHRDVHNSTPTPSLVAIDEALLRIRRMVLDLPHPCLYDNSEPF